MEEQEDRLNTRSLASQHHMPGDGQAKHNPFVHHIRNSNKIVQVFINAEERMSNNEFLLFPSSSERF